MPMTAMEYNCRPILDPPPPPPPTPQLFVKDNQGDEDTTVLSYLGLFGTPHEAPTMKDFKRVRLLCGLVYGVFDLSTQ